jgi:hypothetical protein
MRHQRPQRKSRQIKYLAVRMEAISEKWEKQSSAAHTFMQR